MQSQYGPYFTDPPKHVKSLFICLIEEPVFLQSWKSWIYEGILKAQFLDLEITLKIP